MSWTFHSEGELCDYFAEVARTNGWQVYPEVSGWDLVLCHNEIQIGVEAKLSGKVKLLNQIMNRVGRRRYNECPDFCAALVPFASHDFIQLCSFLRIVVFTADTRLIKPNPRFCLQPSKRLLLPVIPLQSGGGRPFPKALTPWREKALRLCTRLRRDGFVTGHDFEELKLNRQHWIECWLNRDGCVGRYARYVIRPNATLPDFGYERERDLIAEVDMNREAMGL